jgi:hypothetical protein
MSGYDRLLPDDLNAPIEREIAELYATMTGFVRHQYLLPSVEEQLDTIVRLVDGARAAGTDNIRQGYLSEAAERGALAAYRVVVDSGSAAEGDSLDAIFEQVAAGARAIDRLGSIPDAPELLEGSEPGNVQTLIRFAAKALAAAAS